MNVVRIHTYMKRCSVLLNMIICSIYTKHTQVMHFKAPSVRNRKRGITAPTQS